MFRQLFNTDNTVTGSPLPCSKCMHDVKVCLQYQTTEWTHLFLMKMYIMECVCQTATKVIHVFKKAFPLH